MRGAVLTGIVALVPVLVAASSAVVAKSAGGGYVQSCARSTAQWPQDAPPKTVDSLRVGPVDFNGLAPRLDGLRPPAVQLPDPHAPFYRVVSWFNISTAAPHGVTISLSVSDSQVGMVQDGLSAAFWNGLMTRRVPLANAPRSVRFPLCRDTETGKKQITQYGIQFLLKKPGCFTFDVQPVGQRRLYRSTVRVLVSHC